MRAWPAASWLRSTSSVGSPVRRDLGALWRAPRITYEGQAAIELENAVDRRERGEYPIALDARGDLLELDPREAIEEVLAQRLAGVPLGTVAARFHTGLARATARACARLASERGLDTVALSGGVFHNRVLLERTAGELARAGLRTLVPELLPAGDGGISYGQAAVAAARLRGG